MVEERGTYVRTITGSQKCEYNIYVKMVKGQMR